MHVDFSTPIIARNRSGRSHAPRSSARGLVARTRGGRARSASASLGAVRRTQPSFQSPRRPRRKIALAMFGATALVAASTQSVPSMSRSVMSASLLPTLPAPAPRPERSAPTFFFDDATNALGEHSQLLTVMHEGDGEAVIRAVEGILPDTLEAGLASLHQDLTSEGRHLDDGTDQTTVSSLVDHPGIVALRERARHPRGAKSQMVTVKAGDTLSGILGRFGLKGEQLGQLLQDSAVKEHLSTLSIGQQLEVTRLPDGSFHSMEARLGEEVRIEIRTGSGDLAVAAVDLPVEKERVVTSGTIEQSLFLAAEQANLRQSTIMELADIFRWELDFARDIRKGDQFSLVYDRLYRDGRYIGDGDILAAEFIRGGRTYRAIRFTTDDGVTAYYTPDGMPKRRAFLRHPVDNPRITSRFDLQRKHPVLHVVRPHLGTDYGSPYGSPIYATGDGRIKFAGDRSTYGKTVIIDHGRRVTTLYAHMSKISDKVKKGKRVQQGEVIGYVGRTGRVTGTHLHYEYQVNGKHVDSLEVELAGAEPLPKKYRDALRTVSDELIAQMRSVLPDVAEETQLAAAATQ